MLIEPELTLPALDDGQRLFVCLGDPWDQALQDVRTGRADSTFLWNVGRSYKKGDWILTISVLAPACSCVGSKQHVTRHRTANCGSITRLLCISRTWSSSTTLRRRRA